MLQRGIAHKSLQRHIDSSLPAEYSICDHLSGSVACRYNTMIKSFRGKTPRIAASAFVSEAAHVIGDVEIGENSSVWPGAVIRGDFGSIRIGRNTQVEDSSVVHADSDMVIGDSVHIGHGAVIHCSRIGNRVLVGMNATILHCLGIDHRRLSVKFQGLDVRLTGVEDHGPVDAILA